MTTVFVCCEGSTDAGVLKTFIERCVSVSAECKTHSEMKHIRVRNLKSAVKGKNRDDGVGRKAYMRRLAHLANEQNSNHLAYHQDADRKYNRVYKDVNRDLDKHRNDGFRCLAIVPKEMTESWLLADEQAFVAIFGRKPERPTLPKTPETLWGKKENSKSQYPKHVMKRVLEQYHKEPNRDVYAEIAANCDIDTLRRRCNVSFDRFFNDLQGFISQ